MLLALRSEPLWDSPVLRKSCRYYLKYISLTLHRGLFGTPISGELVKHGYIALSVWSGAMLLVGGVVITWARLVQDRRFLARI